MERSRKKIRELLTEMESNATAARNCGASINYSLEGSNRISAVVDDDFYHMMDAIMNGEMTAEEVYEKLKRDWYFAEAGLPVEEEEDDKERD